MITRERLAAAQHRADMAAEDVRERCAQVCRDRAVKHEQHRDRACSPEAEHDYTNARLEALACAEAIKKGGASWRRSDCHG